MADFQTINHWAHCASNKDGGSLSECDCQQPQTTTHKRYMAFAGSDYYPCGGWNDLIGFFDTIDEAKRAMRGGYNWRQIIDTEIMEEV